MEWKKGILQEIEWNGTITNLEDKQRIAKKIAARVKDGDVIGFGSGSTSYLATIEIAERVKKEGLNITAIPTSHEITMLCNQLGLVTSTLMQKKPDWCFDGADEVNSKNWLVKGRGAAMFKEKLNIANSKENYILVDDSKFVENLCDKFPIPVEVFPSSVNCVREALFNMGAESVIMRLAQKKDGPVITENGNLILDAVFRNVNENLEKELKSIVGVIETGLFIGYNITIEK